MPIDPSAIGKEFGPTERAWRSKDAIVYALGVGAGTDELEFTTEMLRGGGQKVLPTFATVIAPLAGGLGIGSFNPAMLVHAEQGIELRGEIPPEGKLVTTGKITGIWDKGSGALVTSARESVDADSGEPIFTSTSSMFIRGEGGWGGERGPSRTDDAVPESPADHSVSYETLSQQALIYRLSGDRNPLHSDPRFAKLAGFDAPIMHGLCTYGFTGRAILHALCGSDPARFRSMQGRFSKPAWPGDTLTIDIWVREPGDALFVTRTQRGDVVIDHGVCTYETGAT